MPTPAELKLERRWQEVMRTVYEGVQCPDCGYSPIEVRVTGEDATGACQMCGHRVDVPPHLIPDPAGKRR